MSFLVTGTGRCGTTWAYDALADATLNVRQQSLRHEHTLGLSQWDLGDHDGEVSFEGAPWANRFDTVVLLWRPCLKVISSWMGLDVFMPGWEEPYYMLHGAIAKWCPEVLDQEDPVKLAASYWLHWNELVRPVTDVILPIEGLTADQLVEAVGFGDPDIIGYNSPPSDTNSRLDVKKKVVVTEEDLGEFAGLVKEYEETLLCYTGVPSEEF